MRTAVAAILLMIAEVAAVAAGPGIAPRELTTSELEVRQGRPQLVLAVERNVTIQPVTIRELKAADEAMAVDEGAWKPGGLHPPKSLLDLTVSREVPGLWRAAVAMDEANLSDHIDIQFTVVSDSGSTSRIEHDSDRTSYIGVTAEPTPSIEIERSPTGRLLEGGAVLNLDLTEATRSGHYRGTLLVTVSRL